MYDFQSAMAEGKARAQRERNRGMSAVRVVSTEEKFMGMTEDDWNDWQEEQASSVDDVGDWWNADEPVGPEVDAPGPVRPKRETEGKTARPRAALHHGAAKTQAMSPAQYVAGLKKLGLTPSTCAHHLGIHIATSFRYSSGSHPIPASIAKLIRAMIRLGTTEI